MIMDYEKKYKEALERARQFSEKPYLEDSKGIVDYIFPELKDSEGERTWIINYLSNRILNSTIIAEKENLKKAIAWLEKQGNLMKALQISNAKIGELVEKNYYLKEQLEKQGEQKPAEWHREDEQNLNACLGYIRDEFLRRWLTDIIHVKYDKPADKDEPKFKVGDTIQPKDPVLGEPRIIERIYPTWGYDTNKGILDFEFEDNWELVEKPAWSEEDEKMIQDIINDIAIAQEQVYCKSRCEDEINWLKSLKDRVQPQPKQEWSEEDEKMLNQIIKDYERGNESWLKGQGSLPFGNRITWLKSLRPHSQWKPSDEQMKCISDVVADAKYKNNISMNGYEPYTHLYTLLRQLKKLREE